MGAQRNNPAHTRMISDGTHNPIIMSTRTALARTNRAVSEYTPGELDPDAALAQARGGADIAAVASSVAVDTHGHDSVQVDMDVLCDLDMTTSAVSLDQATLDGHHIAKAISGQRRVRIRCCVVTSTALLSAICLALIWIAVNSWHV